MTLNGFHKKYIANTYFESIITEKELMICKIPKSKLKLIDSKSQECFITTKSIKHIYDKRTAGEFDYILTNITKFIRNPDMIFEDSKEKSGEFMFVKIVQGENYKEIAFKHYYICIIQEIEGKIYIPTCYRDRSDGKYLGSFKMIWNRRGADLISTNRN